MAVTPTRRVALGSVALTTRAWRTGSRSRSARGAAGADRSSERVRTRRQPGTAQTQAPNDSTGSCANAIDDAPTAAASPLPAGRLGRLAYSLNGHVYLADWDGRNPIRIADGAPVGPASCNTVGCGTGLVADGRHLAYFSGCGAVVIYDVATKAVARSRRGLAHLVVPTPRGLPPGRRTDDDRHRPGRRWRRRLHGAPGCAEAGDYDMRWSPDGTSLGW